MIKRLGERSLHFPITFFAACLVCSSAHANMPSRPGSDSIYEYKDYERRVRAARSYLHKAPGDFKSARRYLDLSWDLMSYGNIQDARKLADLAVQIIPPDSNRTAHLYIRGLSLIAWSELESGRVEAAHQSFSNLLKRKDLKYVKRSKGIIQSMKIGYGRSLETRGEFDEALSVYSDLLNSESLDPVMHLAVLNGTARSLIALNKHKQANAILSPFIDLIINTQQGRISPETVNAALVAAESDLDSSNSGRSRELATYGARMVEKLFGNQHPLFLYAESIQIRSRLRSLSKAADKQSQLEDMAKRGKELVYRLVEYNRSAFSNLNRLNAGRIDLSVLGSHLSVVASLSSLRALSRDEIQSTIVAMHTLTQSNFNRVGELVGVRFAEKNDALAKLIRQEQDASREFYQAYSNIGPRLSTDSNTNQLEWNKLEEMRNRVVSLQKKLSLQHPNYTSIVRPEPPKFDLLQESLPKNSATLVYTYGIDSVFGLVMNSDTAKLIELKVAPTQLDSLIEAVRHEILNKREDLNPSPFYEVYRELYQPFEPHLRGIKTIYVVKDGGIHSLPFSAMLTQKPTSKINESPWNWLIRNHEFRNLPTLSTITQNTRSISKREFLGIGAPNFESELPSSAMKPDSSLGLTTKRRDAVVRSASLVPLPGARDELEQAFRLFRPDRSTLLMGSNATETAFRNEKLDEYQLLLFSTHAVMPGEIPEIGEPSIILERRETSHPDADGILTASELFELELNADWLLLSACNTGSPSKQSSNGVGALARGAIYAGSRGLLASHWPINDESTSRLLSGALKGYSKSGNLSAAVHMQAMRMSAGELGDKYQHPRLWAPFSVFSLH